MKQIALLIGNSAYPEEPLRNAKNDADALAARLGELGFTCLVSTDASAKEMDKLLAEFGQQLKAHEVGLFFFAGHGMQIDGVNYLGATDTNFDTELDAKFSSLSLDKVIETMEAGGNRTSILILDACRTNPYERRWRSGASRGLAPVYAPKGMILAFATSPGQIASDGAGANGTYTTAILAHIGQQNLSIEGFFKRVRNTLSSSTNSKQISWEHTSLMGDYYFNHSSAEVADITGYSDAAFADKEFAPFLRGPVGDIIRQLKSLDWYKQNPAVAQVTPENLKNATKDECFVLGRNIYQAGCGDANAASAFLGDLRRSLAPFLGNTSYHILNGILVEIYFDSSGARRKKAKINKFDEVMALEEDTVHARSIEFIQQKLRAYRDELFYFPGSLTEICVDVVMAQLNESPAVAQICFEGENILYNIDGSGYFKLDAAAGLHEYTKENMRTKLAEAMIVPSFHLKISYVGRTFSTVGFLAPWYLNLRRIKPE